MEATITVCLDTQLYVLNLLPTWKGGNNVHVTVYYRIALKTNVLNVSSLNFVCPNLFWFDCERHDCSTLNHDYICSWNQTVPSNIVKVSWSWKQRNLWWGSESILPITHIFIRVRSACFCAIPSLLFCISFQYVFTLFL